MPKHIIECYDYGHRIEKNITVPDNKIFKCSVCGGEARIVYDWGSMNIDIFQPFTDNTMSDHPVKIESKQQWAKECQARGVTSHALASGYKSYQPLKEI